MTPSSKQDPNSGRSRKRPLPDKSNTSTTASSPPNKQRKLDRREFTKTWQWESNESKKRDAKEKVLDPLNVTPTTIPTNFLSLPVELTCEIFILLDSIADALSLASVSKAHQQRFLACSYRQALKLWPGAFELLDFQRPGYIPEQKRRVLFDAGRYRYTDVDAGTPRCIFFIGMVAKDSLPPKPAPNVTEEDVVQLLRNHTVIEGWIRRHAKFDRKVRMSWNLKDGLWPASFKVRPPRSLCEAENGVAFSRSELNRMVNTFYTVLYLHFNSIAITQFTLPATDEKRKDTDPLAYFEAFVNHAPAFQLSTRQLLEVAVLLRVLFFESRINEFLAWHPNQLPRGHTPPKNSEIERQESPLFSTLLVRRALSAAINHRLCMIFSRPFQGRLTIFSVDEELREFEPANTSAIAYPIRHIFWDENQNVVLKFESVDAWMFALRSRPGRRMKSTSLLVPRERFYHVLFPTIELTSRNWTTMKSVLRKYESHIASIANRSPNLIPLWIGADESVTVDMTAATDSTRINGSEDGPNTVRSKFKDSVCLGKKLALLSLRELTDRRAKYVDEDQRRAEKALRP
ncbi:hypothetical protein BJ508DRAFT_302641 [Ascobolus immersus RN42]|uniref:F-box domain-containing protein n=1 Tax=Ascobolus immersus RN42 TaxID=1160509 RepID=A0A3N4IJJ9_ASCIM|nr:hypothetical protein BJ508DRAFT_302641 [Ascobolus immersus RN42]